MRIGIKKNRKNLLLREPFLILILMLLLIIVLAPFYRSYLNKAHLASDKRLAANTRTAMLEALEDSESTGRLEAGQGDSLAPLKLGENSLGSDSGQTDFWAAVYRRMGVRGPEGLNGQLVLDDGVLLYYTDDEGQIYVVVDYESKPDFRMPET